jgi:hypothetical protein
MGRRVPPDDWNRLLWVEARLRGQVSLFVRNIGTG